ncbi:Phosphoglycerate dehydrogenase [Cribrihabitans marinus]|uniref:Phosphoglycerate dehydrogenase n=1 Tax=Cribrihabitans marinus TaxID=1227549 RepID=A0A1H7D8W3_9RHOB|nr:hydroxyacid dehydrogenase [Cribrihabitans marinus]GGH38186.1 2-hydroxyacid dehydrogenase [Cribrihabitans marinus]SEJ98299.1 Phosphoglycerate dehydrogenase [Cribrihabitans marinus]
MTDRPLVISAPEPRTLDLIFRPERLAELRARYDIHEIETDALATLPDPVLGKARYVIGQPPIDEATLARMESLRCVFNVEGNLFLNMPYARLFERGIHVVTTMEVFARPVAEIGLGLALDLLRGITDSDLAFREGREAWGLDGNGSARLLSGADVGLIGFGSIGRSLLPLLQPFRPRLRIYDPWLPPSLIADAGAEPAALDAILRESDVIFVLASVTDENEGFLDKNAFARMRPGAVFVLLSRAGVVNFDALVAAVASGHIRAASDVFPEEPLDPEHPVRRTPGFLRSAHRAGALDVAFKMMGDMVMEDMDLLDRGLPPMRCKRAERETVDKMRSKPVEKS